MTTFRTTDVLVYNEEFSADMFQPNFGDINDEYALRRSRDVTFSDRSYGEEEGDLVYVRNLRTGNEGRGFWWRLKVGYTNTPYDPTQAGDTADDI